MNRKLQVFISSTYTDLPEERQAAVEAILSAGHIPAGMELFTAGDESQLAAIKRWIDDSDVFMLILGGRYGSIEPKSKKSYIHLEYEYALQNNKPVFAVVISDDALEHKVKSYGTDVIERSNQSKYKNFKSIVLSKICKYFDDPKDIQIAVHSTLADFKVRYKIIGWISGTEAQKVDELIGQNSKLLKENEKLRKELKTTKSKNMDLEKLINGYTFEEIEKTLKETKVIFKKKKDNKVIKEQELNIFEAYITFQDKFAVGINNNYKATDLNIFLYYDVAPKLMIFGLVETQKVAGVAWEKIKTTKNGFKLLANYQIKNI